MIRETFPVGLLGCNCTVLGDAATRTAIVVDPGADLARILAVLARQYTQPQMQGLMGEQRMAGNGDEQGGIFSTIIEAAVKGAVQGAKRQLAPKRRRRRTTSIFGATKRKRTTRKKRGGTFSLDQIFGEILGNLRR